ncbi:tetratricopeptide repeat protein [Alkalimonas amylolytica]|uniref:Tetratricopeptide repeat-containing protein n=1 Tax=Alkalimonas amylolytica TaxID=152573 RepID=A0A1H3XLW6_ALKAM|nr:tetratricopeptide repeat protein [Alkalimonas amylolytica]SEA00455.1 Tetratricopeptide repeat-containing protein [Alkalimonas amylolytica]
MKIIAKLMVALLGLYCLELVAVPAGAPNWLQQVHEQKRLAPEAMLALLQQHEDSIPSLPRQVQRRAYQDFATLFGMMGQHQQQLAYAQKGLALDDAADTLRVELMYNLGFATEMQSNYLEAQQYYQQGMKLAEQLGDESLRLRGVINQAAALSGQEHYQEALALLQQVYQQVETLDDWELEAEVNAELGLLYATITFEEEGVQFLDKAYAMYKERGWRKSKIAVLYNLARSYSFLEQYEQAFATYQRMLTVSQQYDDQLNLYYAYFGLALSSHESGRYSAALTYIQKAEEFKHLLQSPLSEIVHYYEKSLIYSGLQQHSMALQQLMLARQHLQQLSDAESDSMRLNIEFMQAHLQASLGQYEQAYESMQEVFFLFQERFNQESELALSSLRLSFAQEREQAERALLLKDNELQALRLLEADRKRLIQWLWTAVFAITSLVLFILLLWQRMARRDTAPDSPHDQEETKSL